MLGFSVFLSYSRPDPPESYSTSLFEDKLEEAILAEQLGFDMVWIPEHHLIPYMQAPNALMLATQIGMRTSFRIGTMVTLILYRHPLITAGEMALADQLLGGRLEYGMGRGAYEYEFERMGIPFAEARPRFAETLDVLEQIWHSPEAGVSFDGKFSSFADSYVWPRPVQEPHPPLWVAGMTEPTIQWAAQKGYNVTNWPFSSPMSRVATVSRVFHEAKLEGGHDGTEQRIAILRGAFAVESWKDLEKHHPAALDAYRVQQRLHWFTQNADPRAFMSNDPVDDEPALDQVFNNLIVGTPEQCLAKVEEYEELGIDQLMLSFDVGPGHDAVMESMRIFAEGVIRPFRAKRGANGAKPGIAALRAAWRRVEGYSGDSPAIAVDPRELRAGQLS